MGTLRRIIGRWSLSLGFGIEALNLGRCELTDLRPVISRTRCLNFCRFFAVILISPFRPTRRKTGSRSKNPLEGDQEAAGGGS